MTQENHSSDGFGAIALTQFASNPTSSIALRMQHDAIARQMDSILSLATSASGLPMSEARDAILNTANGLTTLRARLEMHHSLEFGMARAHLGSDPRQRVTVETLERLFLTALGEFDRVLMTYPAPSDIAAKSDGFVQDLATSVDRIKECFRNEERDLFPVFDRALSRESSADASTAVLQGAQGA